MECVQVGKTALYFAADYGHEDVVELLLEANADSDLPEKVIQMYQTILYSLSLWYVRTSVRMSWPAWLAQLVTRIAYCYCHHICLLSCPHFAFHLFCQASTYVQLVSHSPAVRPHLIHADRRQREKEIGWPLVVFFGMYCRKATQHLVPIIISSIETYLQGL